MKPERPPLTDEQLEKIKNKIKNPDYMKQAVNKIAEQLTDEFMKEFYPDKEEQNLDDIFELHN